MRCGALAWPPHWIRPTPGEASGASGVRLRSASKQRDAELAQPKTEGEQSPAHKDSDPAHRDPLYRRVAEELSRRREDRVEWGAFQFVEPLNSRMFDKHVD